MTGRIMRIAGSVVDVAFDGGALPRINEALTAELSGGSLFTVYYQACPGENFPCVMGSRWTLEK